MEARPLSVLTPFLPTHSFGLPEVPAGRPIRAFRLRVRKAARLQPRWELRAPPEPTAVLGDSIPVQGGQEHKLVAPVERP